MEDERKQGQGSVERSLPKELDRGTARFAQLREKT